MLPKPLHDAAAAFDAIPGIGPRAALRYASWLAAQPTDAVKRFGRAFEALANGVTRCSTCGAWTDADMCAICRDPTRDQAKLCVVATSQDVEVIESSGAFNGRYHVLGGLINPIEGRTPESLTIDALLTRLTAPDGRITEIILALDPDVTGDATALYLIKRLSGRPLVITRLARGIQHGAQIEYADGTTIADALANRKTLNGPGAS